MLQITNKDLKNLKAFTLVELLIAISIIGIISIISVQGLYDIVSIRAKQQTIEDSSDTFRVVARIITKAVIEANTINVSGSFDAISTTNDRSCKTIKFDQANGFVLYKNIDIEDPATSCSPPSPDSLTANDSITNDGFVITTFTLTPVDSNENAIILEMEGNYKNSLGDHPIKYSTTITKRS